MEAQYSNRMIYLNITIIWIQKITPLQKNNKAKLKNENSDNTKSQVNGSKIRLSEMVKFAMHLLVENILNKSSSWKNGL